MLWIYFHFSSHLIDFINYHISVSFQIGAHIMYWCLDINDVPFWLFIFSHRMIFLFLDPRKGKVSSDGHISDNPKKKYANRSYSNRVVLWDILCIQFRYRSQFRKKMNPMTYDSRIQTNHHTRSFHNIIWIQSHCSMKKDKRVAQIP